MTKVRLLLVAVAGVTLPVILALAAYLLSSSSLGKAEALPVPRAAVATGNPNLIIPEPPSSTRGGNEDASGKCDEARHRNDPECLVGSSTGSGGSGSGSTSGPVATPDDHGGSESPGGSDDGSGKGSSGSNSSGSNSSGSSSGGSGSGGSDSGHSGGGNDSKGGGSDD